MGKCRFEEQAVEMGWDPRPTDEQMLIDGRWEYVFQSSMVRHGHRVYKHIIARSLSEAHRKLKRPIWHKRNAYTAGGRIV